MILDEIRARDILDAAHAAWSRGDVEGILAQYVDDLSYWCNTGAPNGGPLHIEGKDAFRAFLSSLEVIEGISVTEYFRYSDGVGRAQIECFIRHKTSGHTMAGSYRQLVTYRDGKIWGLEEFHDAARMAAFWRLIAGEGPLELISAQAGAAW